VTSSTLLADPPSNETIDVFYIKIAKSERFEFSGVVGLRPCVIGFRRFKR